LLNAFHMPVGLIAQLKEKADIILYSKVFAVYNLVADIFLIKYFGIWGAVAATGTAVLGKNIFIWYSVREEASFRGMGEYFYRSILFWISVSVMVFCIKYFVSNYLLAFIIGVVVFTICFGLQFRCNLFNQYERETLGAIANQNKKINYIVKFFGIRTA